MIEACTCHQLLLKHSTNIIRHLFYLTDDLFPLIIWIIRMLLRDNTQLTLGISINQDRVSMFRIIINNNNINSYWMMSLNRMKRKAVRLESKNRNKVLIRLLQDNNRWLILIGVLMEWMEYLLLMQLVEWYYKKSNSKVGCRRVNLSLKWSQSIVNLIRFDSWKK